MRKGGEEGSNEKKISLAHNSAYNLIKISPSLRTALYCVANTYRKEDLTQLGEQPTARALTSLFQTQELAGLIAAIFLYRRFYKRIEPSERDRLLPFLKQQVEIGWHVGATISNVGYGYGSLIGVVRYAALSTFISPDPKLFAKYRRELGIGKSIFRTDLEEEFWGCNHLQVAALILQSLGMGRGPGLGFVAGSDADHLIDEAHVGHRSLEEALCWRASIAWMESLHCHGKAPVGAEDEESELYLEESSLNQLGAIVARIKESDTPASWLVARADAVPEAARTSLRLTPPDPTKQEGEDFVD